MIKVKKILILILFLLCLFSINKSVIVNAGYTYSHDGKPIYSAEGYSRSKDPYRAVDLGIDASEFKSLQDLYIFDDPRLASSPVKDRQSIYIVDSESNKVFAFDGLLTKESKEEITSFDLDIINDDGTFIYDIKKLMILKSGGKYIVKRSITIEGYNVMEVGTTQNLTYVASPIATSENPLGVSGKVVFETSDKTLATVDENGVVTAVAPSNQTTVEISCYLEDYPEVKTKILISTCAVGDPLMEGKELKKGELVNGQVDVNDFCDSKIKVNYLDKLTLNDGENSFIVEASKTDINNKLTPNNIFFYSSSDQNIVTVNENGEVIAKGEGIATIKVADSFGNSVSFDIEVGSVFDSVVKEKEALFKHKLTIKPSSLSSVFRKYNKKDNTDYLYLCDLNNNQVLVADMTKKKVIDALENETNYELSSFFVKPEEVAFSPYNFKPQKIVVDDAGRMYVISEGTYQGIIQLSKKGEFDRFVGVNYVTLSTWDIIWRQLSTEAQLEASTSILNTTFTSMCIDKTGFIYATSLAQYDDGSVIASDFSKMIKKINHSGKDVLYRNGYLPPSGDNEFVYSSDADTNGPSRFTSITVNDYGVYTVCDGKMGKIFTYDENGNLLYISGGGGSKSKTIASIKTPKAVCYQEENLIVLDSGNCTVNVFEPTKIATYINKAVKYQYDGELIKAQNEWQNVKNLNSNYEYAYVGIGKVFYTEAVSKDHTREEKMDLLKEAMENFKTGFNTNYYSRAYKIYRDTNIERWFEPVMYVVIGCVILFTCFNIYKSVKYGKKEETGIGDE